MTERPVLTKQLDSKTFYDYYYLKEELVNFCRENGIPTAGGKIELSKRIAYFLDTGKIQSKTMQKNKNTVVTQIDENTRIESNIVCSEIHREFFKKQIGNTFKFNVTFQQWLKSNAGKSYHDAILAYYQILKDKKAKKSDINKQFEYNTYIRDFFADNKGKTLEEAIQCWNYKKQLRGTNQYEKSDLIVINSHN